MTVISIFCGCADFRPPDRRSATMLDEFPLFSLLTTGSCRSNLLPYIDVLVTERFQQHLWELFLNVLKLSKWHFDLADYSALFGLLNLKKEFQHWELVRTLQQLINGKNSDRANVKGAGCCTSDRSLRTSGNLFVLLLKQKTEWNILRFKSSTISALDRVRCADDKDHRPPHILRTFFFLLLSCVATTRTSRSFSVPTKLACTTVNVFHIRFNIIGTGFHARNICSTLRK